MDRDIFEPPRFMHVHEAIKELLVIEGRRKQGVCTAQRMAVGLARMGAKTQQMVSGTLEELLAVDFGEPLHSFVLPGQMQDLEGQMIAALSWTKMPQIVQKEQS
jgi:diphthine synthase